MKATLGKKIAPATPNFEALLKGDGIYVDKTAYFHRLITQSATFASYFIARPRRFGKSLMLSTLQAIFEGRRELFEGLYIAEKTDYAWPRYPVLKFDFSKLSVRSPEAFEAQFFAHMYNVLSPFGYAYDRSLPPETNFELAVPQIVRERGPMVLLIDAYDAPIGHAMHSPEMAAYIRARLADFFRQVKGFNEVTRFSMLTGVSKFAQLSVFSSLNSPADLSFDPAYACMLGYTDGELDACFRPFMEKHAEAMGVAYPVYRAELKRWYNGYCFAPGAASVYNPVSVALTLQRRLSEFGGTWIESGPPELLMAYLTCRPGALTQLLSGGVPSASPAKLGNTAEAASLSPLALFYQTGYLTIAEEGSTPNQLMLRIPDEEIRRSLYALYIDRLALPLGTEWRDDALNRLVRGETEAFIGALKDLFCEMPYGSKEVPELVHEAQYRRLLMFMFGSRGIPCVAEKEQSDRNRCDLAVILPETVCIFEFKNDAKLTADDALRQIHARHYAGAYLHSGKRIVLVGLVFDPVTHTVRDAKTEVLRVSGAGV